MIYVFEITDKPSKSKAQILFDSGKSDNLENGRAEIRGEGEAKRKVEKLFKTGWPCWASGIGDFTIGARALRI